MTKTYERTQYFNSWEDAYKDAKARGVCPLQELLALRRRRAKERQQIKEYILTHSSPTKAVAEFAINKYSRR